MSPGYCPDCGEEQTATTVFYNEEDDKYIIECQGCDYEIAEGKTRADVMVDLEHNVLDDRRDARLWDPYDNGRADDIYDSWRDQQLMGDDW